MAVTEYDIYTFKSAYSVKPQLTLKMEMLSVLSVKSFSFPITPSLGGIKLQQNAIKLHLKIRTNHATSHLGHQTHRIIKTN